jgi:hypothetical protein
VIVEKITAIKRQVGSFAHDAENTEGRRFKYRSVDGVVNAVAQALIDHGVVIHSTSAELLASEQVNYGAKSTLGFRTTVAVEYEWTDGESSLTSQVVAEAIDAADKGTAKAMSVAYRIAILQTLSLPTGDKDPDANREDDEEESPRAALVRTLQESGFTLPVQSELIDIALGRHVSDAAKLNDEDCAVAIRAINAAGS